MSQFHGDLGFLGFWDWDLRTGRVTASEEVDRLFGLRFDEVAGKKLPIERYEARVHPDDLAWLREERARCFGPSGHGAVECRVIDAAGHVRWVMCRAVSETDDNNNVVRVRGVMLDLTALKDDGNAIRMAPSAGASPIIVFVENALATHAAAKHLGDSTLIVQTEALLLTAGRLLARSLVKTVTRTH